MPISLPPYLLPYQEEIKIALLSLSLFLILGLIKKKSILHYLIVCIPYVIVIYKFLHSPNLPGGDTWRNYISEFNFLIHAVTNRHFLPEWFPSCGGIRTGYFHIITFMTLPNRIFGYFLYSIIRDNVIFVYKLQYAAGIIFMCFGWWLVLRKLTGCRYAAYFGTLMIMMGGTGISLHQEQVVATTYLIPWFVLSILKMRDDSSYIFPAVILFGLSLNTHLPQNHIISAALFGCIMVLTHPRLSFRLVIKLFREQRKSALILILLFALAILPTLYLVSNLGNLSSALRSSENIFPQNYEEYLGTNCQGFSSALPIYFHQYVKPVFWGQVDSLHGLPEDRQAFFVGRLAFILIFVALLFDTRRAASIFLLLIGFVILTLGKNSTIPVLKFFYTIHFPFIKIFREWYHFFPFVNFCFSALAALGIASLVRFSRKNIILRLAFFLIVIPLLFINIADLVFYDKGCIATFNSGVHTWNDTNNFLTINAREGCGSGYFIQYKNRYRLAASYPQAIPIQPYLTTKVAPVESGVADEFKMVGEIISKGENGAVINAPSPLLDTFLSKNEISRNEVDWALNYEGLSFDITVPENSLLVTPLNYDLGVNAYVDGKKSKVWRVNSALCGILAERGHHRIDLRVALDAYMPIVWTQMLLYIFLFLFFAYKYIKRTNPAERPLA